MLAIIPFVLTAYAEAPSHVDVYDYPFNITLLEGGNFTLYNNGTSNINMVSHGWFNAVALAGGSVTVDLPVERFFADTYYVQDVMNESMSTITIVKPQVNFNATSSETVGTFETISTSETFVEPTIVPVTPATQEEDDIITSSSVSIPTRESDYYNKDTPIYVNDRILNSTGFDITPFVDPVKEVVQETKSTSDTEVLNLRLEILKVIESIFRLVLQ